MENIKFSILENIFENEETPMNHIALIGNGVSGKNELLKQMIGSLLSSNNRILVFHSQSNLKKMVEQLKGTIVRGSTDITKELLVNNKFICLYTTLVDFDALKNLLMESEYQWILVQDGLDEVIYNYEQNEFMTRKLEFLYYFSEFGRVFDVYTLVTGKEITTFGQTILSQKILENSKNLFLLQQSQKSLRFLKKKKWLNDEQVERMKHLSPYEAIFLRK